MKNLLLTAGFLFAAILITGCEQDELNVRQDALTNYIVDIDGSWKLFSISRDGEDLSGKFSFKDYTLDVRDRNFSLSSSTFPFPTLKTTGVPFSSGTLSFNDDVYPTQIQFSNGSEVVPVKLAYPAYGTNNTSLILEFNLGCSSNKYSYHFKK